MRTARCARCERGGHYTSRSPPERPRARPACHPLNASRSASRCAARAARPRARAMRSNTSAAPSPGAVAGPDRPPRPHQLAACADQCGGAVIVARLYAPDLSAPPGDRAGRSAVTISAALAFLYPTIEWYRGLSGRCTDCSSRGRRVADPQNGPVHWRDSGCPCVLLAGGWIKVFCEQPAGTGTPYAESLDAAVIPQAHLVGASAGRCSES